MGVSRGFWSVDEYLHTGTVRQMPRELLRFGDGQEESIARALLSFLKRPECAGRFMTAIGGFVFEEWIRERAEEDGLWYVDLSSRKLPYDCIINGHRVQAKSSGSATGVVDVRPVRPVVGSTVRRYASTDFDVLAVHLASYGEVYFIPVSEFRCTTFPGFVCGSFVRERYTQWIDAWDVIAGQRGGVVEQLSLFG